MVLKSHDEDDAAGLPFPSFRRVTSFGSGFSMTMTMPRRGRGNVRPGGRELES
jgi:hypothetical protein